MNALKLQLIVCLRPRLPESRRHLQPGRAEAAAGSSEQSRTEPPWRAGAGETSSLADALVLSGAEMEDEGGGGGHGNIQQIYCAHHQERSDAGYINVWEGLRDYIYSGYEIR